MAHRRSTSSVLSSQAHLSIHFANPDIFSDDYEVQPHDDSVGHHERELRRDGVVSHDVASQRQRQDSPRRSLSFQRTIEPPLTSSRLSRGSQRSNGHNSAYSRLNGRSTTSHPRRSVTSMSELSNTTSTGQRSSRTISTFGFPRSQSPYQGAAGPSQPYGMYAQEIGPSRTPSMATTSTVRRPERSYSGPSGPTQPYGMYSQGTVPEDDTNAILGLLAPPIVGYPGRDQNFERSLGPDGEDVDDLIGPDGYTEQLPAYSRYANGVPPKYSSGIGSVRRSAPPIAHTDSQETLHSPLIRDQADPINPFNDNSTRVDSTSNNVGDEIPSKNEGGNLRDRIKGKSNRKVCGGLLPCWLLVVLILVVFLAVFLGGVIGGLVAHKRGEEKGRNEAVASLTAAASAPASAPAPTTVTAPSPYAPDAVTLSSIPTNLPPLPTGQFSVVLGGPSLLSNSCLIDIDQSSAWDCATGADLTIDISMTTSNTPVVSLSYPTSPGARIRYGAQPPELSGPVQMSLKSDSFTPNQGPAWTFFQTYNKTVIVRQQDLPVNSDSSRRSFLRRWFFSDEDHDDTASLSERDSSQFSSDLYAEAGEKPWYCFWNDTTLEGFIYDTDDTDPDPVPAAYSSAAVTDNAASSSLWQTPFSPLQTSSILYQIRLKREAQSSPSAEPSASAYPKVIKIEERRSIINTVKPYCQQMQVLYNQQLGFTVPGVDSPLTIQLDETESAFDQKGRQASSSGGDGNSDITPTSAAPTSFAGRRDLLKMRAYNGKGPSCHCQWMAGA